MATQKPRLDDVPDAQERQQLVTSLTDKRGADIVIEASGGTTAFPEGVAMIRRGGRYVIIGQLGAQEVSFAPRFFVEKHLTVIGVLSGDTDHYYKALQFLQLNRERFHFEDMLSNRYRLDQINEAMAAMHAFREIKPVIIL